MKRLFWEFLASMFIIISLNACNSNDDEPLTLDPDDDEEEVIYGDCENEIYVDGSSSGSQNGSMSNPFSTIQAAINAASDGDVIKVWCSPFVRPIFIDS